MILASQTSILHDLGLVALVIGSASAGIAVVTTVTVLLVVSASRREGRRLRLSHEASDRVTLAGRYLTSLYVRRPQETDASTAPDDPLPQVIKDAWGDLEHAPQDIQVIWRTSRLSRDAKLRLISGYIGIRFREQGEEPPIQRRA